jgi:hypothetical protein
VLDLIGPIENLQMIMNGEAVYSNPEQIERAYRGCDASNRYDQPDEHPEFSDDDEEHQRKMVQRRQKEGGYPRT